MEKLDIYNKLKNKTGKIVERSNNGKLEKDEYVLGVQCWIVNSDGKILMTRRNLEKKRGGKWEPTSGLVRSGESSLQGVKRELQEEIGVNVSDNELHFIEEQIEEKENVNLFKDVYLIKKDIDLNDLHFNDGEVIDAKYVTLENMLHMIEQGESFEWLRYFENIYRKI